MDSDGDRWDARYREATAPEARRPEALDDTLESLLPQDGTAVDVACGTGAQALWLAEQGLQVVAIDASQVAVDLLATVAVQSGSAIDARCVDLEDGLPSNIGPVDVLVCQRFRDPRLYDTFVEVLRPGGIGIVTVLSAVGLDDEPGPFHAPPGDLHDAFDRDDVELLRDTEHRGVASVVFRRR